MTHAEEYVAESPILTSRLGTWLDPDVFGRLNAACDGPYRRPRAVKTAEPERVRGPIKPPLARARREQKPKTTHGKGICSLCDRPSHAHGWCRPHYRMWLAHGDAAYTLPRKADQCGAEGCGREVHALGLCRPHYKRMTYSPHPDSGLVRIAEASRIYTGVGRIRAEAKNAVAR